MVALSGVPNITSASVYRKMHGQGGGRLATQVNPTEASPDAGYREMGKKAAGIRIARQEKSKELYEIRMAQFMPHNIALENAVQHRIRNPKRNDTLKMIDAIRDLRGGVYAGPLPASAMAAKQRHHSLMQDLYM